MLRNACDACDIISRPGVDIRSHVIKKETNVTVLAEAIDERKREGEGEKGEGETL